MAAPQAEGRAEEQIEYLLYQSTQGIHFIFENSEIARVLRQKGETGDGEISIEFMGKVQTLLTGLLEKPSMGEKKSYLESLNKEDYELLLRAYFQLVDKTILAHSDLKH